MGAVDDNGLGALHYAAMRDRSDVAALLLAAGADPLLRDDTEMGYTPLHVCVHYDARGTLAALLADEGAKAGIDTVCVVDGWEKGDGRDVFMPASSCERNPLIDSSPSTNIHTTQHCSDFRDGFSPLMLAAVRESKEVAIMLLRVRFDD